MSRATYGWIHHIDASIESGGGHHFSLDPDLLGSDHRKPATLEDVIYYAARDHQEARQIAKLHGINIPKKFAEISPVPRCEQTADLFAA